LTLSQTFEIKPQLLTVSTRGGYICSLPGGPPCHEDVYVCCFSAYTGLHATSITDADEQTIPVTHDNGIALAANSRYSLISGIAESDSCIGEWFPGGMTITPGNARNTWAERSKPFVPNPHDWCSAVF
jgi:hypothetical protein